jgi:hypothetical protein
VNKAYDEYFITIMTKEEFYIANKQSCIELRNLEKEKMEDVK